MCQVPFKRAPDPEPISRPSGEETKSGHWPEFVAVIADRVMTRFANAVTVSGVERIG